VANQLDASWVAALGADRTDKVSRSSVGRIEHVMSCIATAWAGGPR
jgi:hypothetical protein